MDDLRQMSVLGGYVCIRQSRSCHGRWQAVVASRGSFIPANVALRARVDRVAGAAKESHDVWWRGIDEAMRWRASLRLAPWRGPIFGVRWRRSAADASDATRIASAEEPPARD
jgi:hypothetical protein